MDEGQGRGLGHAPSTRCCRARRPSGSIASARAPGADPGDRAPHRPVAAGGHRPARRSASTPSGSTATCCRPTVAPDRVDLRRLRARCTTPVSGWCRAGSIAKNPLDHGMRRDLGRHRRRPAGARPPVSRGLDRRRRLQRDHDRHRRTHRGAGHGRRATPSVGPARRAARSRRGRHRQHHRGPARAAGRRCRRRACRAADIGWEAALPQLVCASANPDKVAEIALVLDGLVDLLPRPEGLADVVEDAPDLEGNARLKAAAVCAAAGAAAVSDDTGLEVDALGGRAGCPLGALRRRRCDLRRQRPEAARRTGAGRERTPRPANRPVPDGGDGGVARRLPSSPSRAWSRG